MVEGGALNDPAFKEWSKKYVPFLHVTTRIEGRKNDDLLSEKGLRGFPSFVFMNPSGTKLAEQAGPMSLAQFKEMAAGPVQEYLDLKAKAASGDEQAIIELTLKEAEMGSIPDAETLDSRLTGIELTEAQKAKVESLKTDLKIDALFRKARALAKTDRAGAGEMWGSGVAKILKEGGKPSKKHAARFYDTAFRHGLQNGDLDLASKAYKGLNEALKDEPRAAQFLTQAKQRLEQAKAAAEAEPAEPTEPEEVEPASEEGDG